MVRSSGRSAGELRPVTLSRRYTRHPEGSVLVEFGDTRVLCTASVEARVPPFLKGRGSGWITAEDGMLPRATHTRGERGASRGRQGGRTHEIQRLIGRALRAVVDLPAMGERTIQLDCDVIQADGGTRTAAITGSFVALCDAMAWMRERAMLTAEPVRESVAAVSVGVVDGIALLDLDYAEDSACETDMNVVMTSSGALVELQGTAEGKPFSDAQLQALLALARSGIARLIEAQKAALAAP